MLRDYQTKLVAKAYSAWQDGARNVCAQLPTGGGKTPILAKIARDNAGESVTIAHRQELVGQISLAFARSSIVHRIIAPDSIIRNIGREHLDEFGRSFINQHSIAAVAGVDTLVARQETLDKNWLTQVTLWQIDEAHHVLQENKWGQAVSLFPNSRGLGVTATPSRADGKGLGIHADGVFHKLVIGPTTRDLINTGYLTEYEIVIPKNDFDRERLVIGASGDYTPKSLQAEAERSKIIGDIVDNYLVWAFGTQTIVFTISVDTSNEVAQRFNDTGIIAKAVSAKTPEYERFQTIREFRERKIAVLVNCDLFGEGFDVPGVETIIMARPTKSLGLYLQQIGRGLRPATGKTRALIIDHVSNVREHGLPDRPRLWTLDGRDRRKKQDRDPDDIPVTTCTECYRVYERIHRACPYCQHEPVPIGRGSIEQVDGDLTLLDAGTLAKMRAAILLESPGNIAERVGYAAGEIAAKGAAKRQLERIEVQRKLADAIALWAGHGRAAGKTDSELYRRFYFMTGIDVITALSGTREEMEKLLEQIQ